MTQIEHVSAIRSVAREPTFPRASENSLKAARDAGHIKFCGWPSGHWQITPSGYEILRDWNSRNDY